MIQDLDENALVLQAIDDGFKDHICRLFSTQSMAAGITPVVENVMHGIELARAARAELRRRIADSA